MRNTKYKVNEKKFYLEHERYSYKWANEKQGKQTSLKITVWNKDCTAARSTQHWMQSQERLGNVSHSPYRVWTQVKCHFIGIYTIKSVGD